MSPPTGPHVDAFLASLVPLIEQYEREHGPIGLDVELMPASPGGAKVLREWTGERFAYRLKESTL